MVKPEKGKIFKMSNNIKTKSVHLLISGRVQGVGFRYFVLQKARETGVNGWVRNLNDGRVEALISGDEDAVEKMVAFCRRGPESAIVENTDLTHPEQEVPDTGFRIRYF